MGVATSRDLNTKIFNSTNKGVLIKSVLKNPKIINYNISFSDKITNCPDFFNSKSSLISDYL